MLDSTPKKALAAAAAVLLLLTAAAFSGFLSFTTRSPEHVSASSNSGEIDLFARGRRKRSYDELMRVILGKRGDTTAEKFAGRFLARPVLRGSWRRLHKTKDVKAFGSELRASRDFNDIVQEFDGDSSFQRLVSDIARRLPMVGKLGLLQKRGVSRSATAGNSLDFVRSDGLESQRRKRRGSLAGLGVPARRSSVSTRRGAKQQGVCSGAACRSLATQRDGDIRGRRTRDISVPDIGGGEFVPAAGPGDSDVPQSISEVAGFGGGHLDGDGVEDQSSGTRGVLQGDSVESSGGETNTGPHFDFGFTLKNPNLKGATTLPGGN